MANKINPQMINNIKSMMSIFNSGNNPQALLQNMVSQNPQFRNVMDMINGSNMSPKDFFMKTAKEKGLDPDEILKQLNIN